MSIELDGLKESAIGTWMLYATYKTLTLIPMIQNWMDTLSGWAAFTAGTIIALLFGCGVSASAICGMYLILRGIKKEIAGCDRGE